MTPSPHPQIASGEYGAHSLAPQANRSQAHELDGASLRQASEAAYRRMERAFIAWHVFGCFGAAAEYQQARQAWELAVMEGTVG